MKTIQDIQDVLARVKFPSYSFQVKENTAGLYLQIVCDGVCNVTGEAARWHSRKWALSYHMTDGEVVQTAFKAVLTALEHEARELFTYRDTTIFDPHYDIEKLVELRRQPDSVVEREYTPRTMTSFYDSLSDEQKADALNYRGPENHGDEEFLRKMALVPINHIV